jgi:hypothetical protein
MFGFLPRRFLNRLPKWPGRYTPFLQFSGSIAVLRVALRTIDDDEGRCRNLSRWVQRSDKFFKELLSRSECPAGIALALSAICRSESRRHRGVTVDQIGSPIGIPVPAVFAFMREVFGDLRLFRKKVADRVVGNLGVGAFGMAVLAAENPFRIGRHWRILMTRGY